MGAEITLPDATDNDVLALFDEAASRVVVTCAPDAVQRVETLAAQHGLHIAARGTVSNGTLLIRAGQRTLLNTTIAEMAPAWSKSLEQMLQHDGGQA